MGFLLHVDAKKKSPISLHKTKQQQLPTDSFYNNNYFFFFKSSNRVASVNDAVNLEKVNYFGGVAPLHLN